MGVVIYINNNYRRVEYFGKCYLFSVFKDCASLNKGIFALFMTEWRLRTNMKQGYLNGK